MNIFFGYVFAVICLCGMSYAGASEYRAWLPQGYMYEGDIPSARSYHGVARSGEKIYAFGGIDNNGSTLTFIELFVLMFFRHSLLSFLVMKKKLAFLC